MYQNIIYLIENCIFLDQPKFTFIDLVLPDDETIIGAMLNSNHKNWIIVVPGGLNGSHCSPYCREIAQLSSDYNILIVNHRGCHIPMTKQKITLHWDIDTIESGIRYININHKPHFIFLLGISMGSMMITHYLQNPHPKVKGAIMFAHYFNLKNHTHSVQSSPWLHRYALMGCKDLYNIASRTTDNEVNLDKNIKITSLSQAIKDLILPYRDMTYEEYLSIDTKDLIDSVSIPCCYVNSTDDPLSKQTILKQYASNNSNITYKQTSYGGHLGWHIGFLTKTSHTFFKEITKEKNPNYVKPPSDKYFKNFIIKKNTKNLNYLKNILLHAKYHLESIVKVPHKSKYLQLCLVNFTLVYFYL